MDNPTALPSETTSHQPRTQSQPAWDKAALFNPHHEADKASRVNAMFDAIVESYDLNNHLHSLGMDRRWRKKSVQLARVRTGLDHVVDVACGTGDLSFAFAAANPASVTGIDFVPRMVEFAAHKGRSPHLARLPVKPVFQVGDAMQLSNFADECADIVSIAFGIRNVADPARAISEFRRILKPGGRLIILEFSEPTNPLFRRGYDFYFRHVMPHTATWISRDRSGAYRYLPRSVSTFMTREEMRGHMLAAGFESVSVHPMTLGICIGYLGVVGTER